MYFVTCFDRHWYRAQEVFRGLASRTPDDRPGASRTFGYFLDQAAAVAAVLENLSDIHEGSYVLCVIERMEPGFGAIASDERWFRWDAEAEPAVPGVWPKGKWVAMPDKPEACEGCVNFALG